MKKRINIIGASGFVGKNLVAYLSKKTYDICAPSRAELTTVTFSSEDAIIHLAGKAHHVKKFSESDKYYEANFELTKTMYDHFLASNAKKFIFMSSVKAVADIVEGVLTETDVPNPQTDYGKSKLMAEEYIVSKQLPPGKFYFILRPCMIHGPNNKGNLNLLYKFVKKGIPYPLAAFNNKRSFLSIENLCFIIKELIENNNIKSGIYQVADDETLSTNEVVTILSKSIHKKPLFWKISPRIIRVIAKIGDILHLHLNTERLDKLTENYIVTNRKIKQAIGKELPMTTKEGLKVTALSFTLP